MREGVKGDKMKRQKRESDTDDAVVRYLGSCLAFMVLLRWFGGFDGVLACTLSRFAAAPVPLKEIQTSNNYLFPSLFALRGFHQMINATMKPIKFQSRTLRTKMLKCDTFTPSERFVGHGE
jgi:hypothetical protein